MAKFRVEDYFNHTSVSPAALIQGQIIQFNYKSPDGVTDKKPLVYVFEKRIDRFFGINLHYDMSYFTEIIENKNAEINNYLKEIFVRDKENKEKLYKEHNGVFTKELITEDQYREFMINFQRRKLEEFIIANPDMKIMRNYLYSRMNNVTKLVYKK